MNDVDGMAQRIYERVKAELPTIWLGMRQRYLLEAAIKAELAALPTRDDGLEEAAVIAEDPRNLDPVGGSTGNMYGTAKRIAAAIRARKGG